MKKIIKLTVQSVKYKIN